MFDKILILSPHTDDAELGAGGTIARFVEEEKEVYYVSFSSCEVSVPSEYPKDILKKECIKSTKILGILSENLTALEYSVRTFPQHRQEILEDMVKINRDIAPDLVLLPSSNDMHQDHHTVYEEGLRAFKKTSSIWGYEHPWNNLAFTTDIFIMLSSEHLKKKIEALSQYKSQDFRTYFDEKYINSLAYTRGMQVDFSLAETFESIRLLMR